MELPSHKEKRTSEHYDRVKEFMQKAGQDTPSGLTVPSEEVRILRAKLILEEALETITKGLGVDVYPNTAAEFIPDNTQYDTTLFDFDCRWPVDLEELADGCADLKVVTTGTLIACGIEDEELQRVVDESNLKKFEPPICPKCERRMTYSRGDLNYKTDLFGPPYWEHRTGPCYHTLPIEAGPHTREDGKHIKPPYWKKPDIAGVIGLEA